MQTKKTDIMNNPLIIAVDAMGGDDSPNKVIEGINIHSKKSHNIIYKIFGNKKIIDPIIKKNKISSERYVVIHTDKVVEGEDTPLSAAKKGKDTSLWLAIDCLKKNEAHAIISAGNIWASFDI